MEGTTVSIVFPINSYTPGLVESVRGLLEQDWPCLEVLLLDSSSSDQVVHVADQFNDRRVRHIALEKGSIIQAIEAGLSAAEGSLVALVDAYTIYHPERLRAHVALFDTHPEIDAASNIRINVDSTGNRMSIWRPPANISLEEVLLGNTFHPGDYVLRKSFVDKIGFTGREEHLRAVGYDSIGSLRFNSQLALSGCRLANIPRPLSLRRPQREEKNEDLAEGFAREARVLDAIFSDPRYPQELVSLRERALAFTHVNWSCRAFLAEETSLGQNLLRKGIRLDRTYLDIQAEKYLDFLVTWSIHDGDDHEAPLRCVFDQLPLELAWMGQFRRQTFATGYLRRGVREIAWERFSQGEDYLKQAATLGARLDRPFLVTLFELLSDHEEAFGSEVADSILDNLARYLSIVGAREDVRWFKGTYLINRAFRDYERGSRDTLRSDALRSLWSHPAHLLNRGVLAMLLGSLFNSRPPAESVTNNP